MTQRDRMVVMVLGCLALVAAAWLVLLKPKRAEQSDLATQLSGLRTELAHTREAVDAGKVARASRQSDEAALAELGAAVPADEQFPSLLVQVQGAAQRSGIVFRKLALSGQAGAAGPSTAITAGATGPSGSSGAAGPAPTSNAEPAPAPASAPTQASATGTLAPGVILDSSGLPTLPFDFTFSGRYFDFETLLGRLAGLVDATGHDVDVTGRLLDVDAFSLSASAQGLPHMDASVHAKAYLWPAEAPAGMDGPSGTASDAAAAAAAVSTVAPAPPSGGPGPTTIPPASTGASPR